MDSSIWIPNGANGAAANRRVEIFLSPRTIPVITGGDPTEMPPAASSKNSAPVRAKSNDDDGQLLSSSSSSTQCQANLEKELQQ